MKKKNEYPEDSDLVVCTVKSVKNFGAFVLLEEYDGKEGFIHVSEIATGWVKRMSDHVRDGQRVVCKVMQVSPEKGHVDLSLKKVNQHQKREKIQEWKNEQKAAKLFEIMVERLDLDLDESMEEFGYNLMDEYGTLYAAFETAAIHDGKLPDEEFEGEWMTEFGKIAKENISPPYVKISGKLELTTYHPSGIERIKEALIEARGEDEDEKIDVKYIGAPYYRIEVEAIDYKEAEDVLKRAADRAVSCMEQEDGKAIFHREE